TLRGGYAPGAQSAAADSRAVRGRARCSPPTQTRAEHRSTPAAPAFRPRHATDPSPPASPDLLACSVVTTVLHVVTDEDGGCRRQCGCGARARQCLPGPVARSIAMITAVRRRAETWSFRRYRWR